MKVKVYSVRDKLVGEYMPPVTGQSDAAMVRNFGDAVLKGDTSISKHPEDYTIERIGEMDTETGVITATPAVVLAHASDFGKDGK